MSRVASAADVGRVFSETVDSSRNARDEPLSVDFAITSVQIPDRLDTQSINLQQSDTYRRASWFSISRSTAEFWLRRLLALCLLAAIGWLVWLAAQAAISTFSKPAIGARISAATGLSVTIAERELSWLPVPAIVLRDLRIGSNFRADRVEIRYSWDGVAQSIRRRGLLPEATVSPLQLSAEQTIDLVALAPMMSAVPGLGVGAVRFESLTFRGMPLLPGEYEVLLQRQPDGRVAPLELRQLGGVGEMQLRVMSDGSGGALRFDLSAQGWTLPFGPAVMWDSLVAQGRGWSQGVAIESFSGKTAAAQVDGAWVAASDVQWSVAGSVRSSNADIESAIRILAARSPETFRSPFRGRANVDALGGGHGPSLTAAVERSVYTGRAQARTLLVTGINLGRVAAPEGSVQSAGGITRLTEVTAALQWSREGVAIRDIRSQSGGMQTRGQIAVMPDLRMSGGLIVDLTSVLPQTPPTVVQIGGSLLNPTFSRP